MRTNRSSYLTSAALFMAFAVTACTDSPDPVSVPRQVSPPPGPSLSGDPTSSAIRFTSGAGQLDITDVRVEHSDGVEFGGHITVTGKYEIKSVPACGGCKVTAFIGWNVAPAPGNSVLAETDGQALPVTGTFRWTTRAPSEMGWFQISGGLIESSQFNAGTWSTQGVNLQTGEDGWVFSSVLYRIPGIFPIFSDGTDGRGWFKEDANLSWELVFDPRNPVEATGCDPVGVTTDTKGLTITCSLGRNSKSVTIRRDATLPTLHSVAVDPAPNASGWSRGPATVSWHCSDETSGPTSELNSETFPDGRYRPTLVCFDNANNRSSTRVSVNVDGTGPTLSPTMSVNPVPLNGSATASPNASDAVSGLATASCDPIVTNRPGTFTVQCRATDVAGNIATKSVSYVVAYSFGGFLSPIVPGTLNSRTAGAAVPVQFRLGGNMGLDIFAPGSPSSKPLTCPAGAPVTTVTGPSASSNGGGLQYDAATDTYTYLWKTEKAWAGTCRTLVVKLKDGIERTADFQLRK